MSKWLKQLLFGIWGLLLIPLIAPILEKWLEENVFSDSSGITTTAFSNTMAAAVFSNLLALGQRGQYTLRKITRHSNHVPRLNLHSARGTAGAPLPAISCLGAFRTPAAAARG